MYKEIFAEFRWQKCFKIFPRFQQWNVDQSIKKPRKKEHTTGKQSVCFSYCCFVLWYCLVQSVQEFSPIYNEKNKVQRVFGFCGLQWCGFHLCVFSTNSPNIQLTQFSLHKWRNSFTLGFLVTLESGINVPLGSCGFFPDLIKHTRERALMMSHVFFWPTYLALAFCPI